MLKRLIHRFVIRRHFWRNAGFDELTEMYLSNMLHTLAVSVLMVFVPFYLYQNGYSIPAIFALFGSYFAARVILDIVAAYTVANIGPKHTLIISCFLQIAASAMLVSVPSFHWEVWQIGIIWGSSASFFFIALHVAFSKVKHSAHAGKEIGYLHIVDKIGGVIGPLLGGVAGTLFGSSYIFVIATLVLFASLWPLFLTAEPVKTHQKIHFKGLPVTQIKRDLLSYAGLTVENSLLINLWPLYVSLFVLVGSTVYLQLGILTSIAVLFSIACTYFVGKFVDVKSGRPLLRVAVIGNALLYPIRPFITTVTGVALINFINEALTVSYRLPYLKGFYAATDDLPGYRIVYVASMEAFASLLKGTAWFMLAILALMLSPKVVIVVGFAVAGSVSLLMLTEKYKALR